MRDIILAGTFSILLTVSLIAALSLQSARYEHNAADRSADYSGIAEREISRHCFLRRGADYAECVNEGEKAKRQYEREEENLAAQKVSAWWTWVMGAAAVAGVILSTFGVFLVYRTFRATREANTISREVAAAELRPWVKIDMNVTKFVADDTSFDITFEIIFTNIGQTVAEGFAFETNSTFFRLDTEYIKSEYAKRGEPEKKDRLALMPGEERKGGGSHTTKKRSLPWHETKTRKTVSFVVTATAFYRSAMDEAWHRTDRSFLVGRKDGGLNSGYFLYDDMREDGRGLVAVRSFIMGETT